MDDADRLEFGVRPRPSLADSLRPYCCVELCLRSISYPVFLWFACWHCFALSLACRTLCRTSCQWFLIELLGHG